ncbi:cytochrome-c peroxidase [Maribacter sp. 2307UL18-2]|uniref:cytochrome-c peroxidase n=1 Tax=Maribacter sp. 2307UL18-2 TaxID=3386274 RepID=UPI0039BD2BFE
MNLWKNLKKPLYLCGALFIGSCSVDSELLDIKVTAEDLALKEQLTELSGSLDFYILPESDDLENIPADPKNPLTAEKVLLGQLLFHETGLATNAKLEANKGTYSCASCHHRAAGFQSGIKQGIGDGGSGFGLFGEARKLTADYTAEMADVQPIKSPTVLNAAYQKVMLWNGQFGATGPNLGTESNWTPDTPKETNTLGFEGVETQAIAGLTVHRMSVTKEFLDDSGYTFLFDQAFPDLPEAERYTLTTTGLAIAAYERTLLANESNFQKWLKGSSNAMSIEEKKGAALFFGKANCYECHSGPALNSEAFYALGLGDLAEPAVPILVDEATKKGRGGFTKNPSDDYKFKVPQLYNLKDVNFFGHGGSLQSIKEIIVYKNRAVKESFDVSDEQLADQFIPLNLDLDEIEQLTQFVENSLQDKNLQRYEPSGLPTEKCFPNADRQSKEDLNCDN